LEEIKNALRELLREELAPIHQRFEQMDQRFEQMDQRFEQMDQRFVGIDQRFEHIDEQLTAIRHQLDRLEQQQQEDVVGILKLMNAKLEKLETNDDVQNQQIALLNERVFRLETDVRMLAKTN
jgi:archaellum component FlaC